MVEIQVYMIVFFATVPICRDAILATPNDRWPFMTSSPQFPAGIVDAVQWYTAVDSVQFRCYSGVNWYSASVQWSSPMSTVNYEV